MIKQQQDVLTDNSLIADQSEWVDGVYEIAEQDYVHGGPRGYSNVPHEQLANRTRYLKSVHEQLVGVVNAFKLTVASQDAANAQDITTLRQAIVLLQSGLVDLQKVVSTEDAKLQAEVDQLQVDVTKVADDLAKHVHLYAGSDVPGGDALTVRIADTQDKMYVTGVVDGGHGNLIARNTKVAVINDTVVANNFTGDLVGNATSATRLYKPFTITVTGDVSGMAKVDGGSDVNITSTLAYTGVAPGKYGPTSDAALDNYDKFIVPQFTVNASGMITKAVDRTLMLPSLTRSRTSGATDTTGKLFIVGAQQQTTVEQTYTEANAYVCDGILFSNNDEVVNLKDHQDLVNKTYNGFTLNDACARDVDDTVGGTLGSPALITSDAVKRHDHNYPYAGSTKPGGPALDVVVDPVVADRHPVVNDGSSTKIEVNSTVMIGNGSIATNDIMAVNTLTIPGGGQLWLDGSINGVSANPGAIVNQNSYDDSPLRARINALSDDITVVDQRVSTVTAAVADDHKLVDDVVDRIAEVKSNLTIVNAAYAKLSSVINNDHAAVISSVDDVQRLKSTVTTLSNTSALTSNDVTRLEADLKAINDKVDAVNADVEAMKVGGRVVTLAPGATCSSGMLLSYAKGGYVLADCSSPATADHLVLSVEKSSKYSHVTAIDGGHYALVDATHDGDSVYVGVAGKLTFSKPASGAVVCVGFVEGNVFVFRPSAA